MLHFPILCSSLQIIFKFYMKLTKSFGTTFFILVEAAISTKESFSYNHHIPEIPTQYS